MKYEIWENQKPLIDVIPDLIGNPVIFFKRSELANPLKSKIYNQKSNFGAKR